MRHILFLLFVAFSLQASAQQARVDANTKRNNLKDSGYFGKTKVDNIGPTIMGGRITDIEINPDNHTEFYVAYASGGLWHTTNNGTTYSPIFDHEAVMTIGDFDVHWPSRTIYVGTGEVNSSRSSYAGVGMYKSTDNGKNWTHIGLPESQHIGRVLIDKSDRNIINVAVLGNLYSASQERGFYRSTDGGNTWTQTLYVNDNAGGIDMVAHPDNPSELYGAVWERTRRAWNFTEAGKGSGIYKSTDHGATWTKVSGGNTGFPENEGMGRIGLDLGVKDGKTYVYAIVDNYNRRPKTDEKKDANADIVKEDFENMTSSAFANLDNKKLNKYLRNNRFQGYDAEGVKEMVASGKVKPSALKEYVEDANKLLFDSPVISAEVYVTTDGGKSWKKTHKDYFDGIFYSYGYYFAQIRVSPADPMELYAMGVPILRSQDGGKSWKSVNGSNVHVDHHELWINPENPNHIMNGNDGGLNISYDKGDNWIELASPPVGQFYYINADNKKPYNVYGGLQDNGVWAGPSTYTEDIGWQSDGAYPYKFIMGGDGMQVQIDSRDNNTIYTGSQFGNYSRIDMTTGRRAYITPKHKLGDRPYRWNWQSPILISQHNEDIIYFGCNKLLRSFNKGDDFDVISGDLTTGGRKGDVPYGTLTTISESPFQFGLIYTGSDDGKAYVTKDGGLNWTDISAGLPGEKWISRIIASQHEKSRVYASLTGYRDDDFKTYLYVSEDYGRNWKSIAGGLPMESVNVIKEDATHEDILYVGTDHGAYISNDRGRSYMAIAGVPHVPVHDMVVQEREKDLLIGTHGRSIYKMSLKPYYEYKSSGNPVVLIARDQMRHSSGWGQKTSYRDPVQPSLPIKAFAEAGGKGTLNVYHGDTKVYSTSIDLAKGASDIAYDMTVSPTLVNSYTSLLKKDNKDAKVNKKDDGNYYLQPGKYTIELVTSQGSAKHELELK